MKGIIPYKVCVIRNKRTAEGRWCWTVASAKCIDLWWWTPWRRSSCLHAHLLSQWSERGFFHVIVNVQNEKHSTYGAKSFSQQGCGGWVGFIPLWPSSVLVWLHSFGSGKQNMPAFWPFRVWSSPLKKFTPSTSRRPPQFSNTVMHHTADWFPWWWGRRALHQGRVSFLKKRIVWSGSYLRSSSFRQLLLSARGVRNAKRLMTNSWHGWVSQASV